MFHVFSVIRLKGGIDFYIGKFEEVFYFPSALDIVVRSFERAFLILISFISKYVTKSLRIESIIYR